MLQHELDGGNTIRTSENGGWTKIDYVVYLTKSLDLDFVHSHTSSTVLYNRNIDPHYGHGDTVVCTTCHCGMMGPESSTAG